MRYQLINASDGSLKKYVTIPTDLYLKGKKTNDVKPKQKKRTKKHLHSVKPLINGYNRYKQKSKSK